MRHPKVVLWTILNSVTRTRRLGSLIETLLLFISELLEGMNMEGMNMATDVRYPRLSDSKIYVPTDFYILPSLLRYLNSDDIVIDLGCGKGRVLWFVATRRKLRKVIGVEIDPALVQIARENMAKAKLRTPVTIIEGDAARADLSEGTVYFMFNPFGEETLRRVLENISSSLEDHPRSIRILYEHPVLAHVLDDTIWLRAQNRNGFLRIWTNDN